MPVCVSLRPLSTPLLGVRRGRQRMKWVRSDPRARPERNRLVQRCAVALRALTPAGEHCLPCARSRPAPPRPSRLLATTPSPLSLPHPGCRRPSRGGRPSPQQRESTFPLSTEIPTTLPLPRSPHRVAVEARACPRAVALTASHNPHSSLSSFLWDTRPVHVLLDSEGAPIRAVAAAVCL